MCVSVIVCMCVVFFSSRRRHTRCALVTGVQTCALPISSPGWFLLLVTAIVQAASLGGDRFVGAAPPSVLGLTALLLFGPKLMGLIWMQIGRASCRERVCQYV